MKDTKSVFACSQCGGQQPKWVGKCPDCGVWNSMGEEIVRKTAKVFSKSPHSPGASVSNAIAITKITEVQVSRTFCGLPELDRVLGGGLVKGSFVLLSGDPGVGKSTLLLQALYGLAHQGLKVLYASGEESGPQVKMRAERLGCLHDRILILNETQLENILDACEAERPDVLVVDSIQTVQSAHLPASSGSVSQVRECAGTLMNFAKSKGIVTWIVGHVTKEGNIAGPKVLEHLVDTVLYLEGDPNSGYRILRAEKNRFGSTGEIGVFSMGYTGLKDVANPSALFLEGHKSGIEGSAVVVCVEGTRPLLVEIQALVGKSSFSTPRRTVTGLDANRFTILAAVLEKRAGLQIGTNDVYANVAGGLKISEPATDIALAAAIMSSLYETPLLGRIAFFGEVGLSGEIRATSHAVLRVQEAQKLGFDRVYLPTLNFKREREEILRAAKDLQVYPIEHVGELRNMIRG